MFAFLTQRLLQIIPTLILVSMLIFGLQQLLPGDPALIMAGEERDPKVLAEIREQYKLDQPIPVQYLYWVKGVLTGNLGESMRLKSSVSSLVAEKLPLVAEKSSNLTVSISIGPAPRVSVGGKWTRSVSGTELPGIASAGRACCGRGPSGSMKLIGCGASSGASPGGVLEPGGPCSLA